MNLSTVEVFKHVKPGQGMVEVTGDRLDELKRVLLMMLSDIDRACREASVDYMLGGGSCLGAIRHQGFIPWDDDLDLNMPHDQFPAFAEALETLFPGKYLVQVPGKTKDYDVAFPRVRLRGTVIRNKDDIALDEDVCGLYVEFFYIENAPGNAILRGLHGLGSLALGLLYSCRRFADHVDDYLALIERGDPAARTFKVKAAIGKLLSFRTTEQWTTAWDRWNSLCRDAGSKYVCVPAGRRHYFGETYRRDTFFPTVRTRFEGLDVPVPADSDAYLSQLYGSDYMTPPPPEARETHFFYEFDLGEYAPSHAGGKGAHDA